MRRHRCQATGPLARLVVDDEGITAGLRLPLLSRLVTWTWSEIERVEPVRDPIRGRNVGVAFFGRGRLVFWCRPSVFDRIVDDVRRSAPGKFVDGGRMLVLIGVVLARRARQRRE